MVLYDKKQTRHMGIMLGKLLLSVFTFTLILNYQFVMVSASFKWSFQSVLSFSENFVSKFPFVVIFYHSVLSLQKVYHFCYNFCHYCIILFVISFCYHFPFIFLLKK
jgi:hypothetical protein